MTEDDKEYILDTMSSLKEDECWEDDTWGISETIVLSIGYATVWKDGEVTANRKIIAKVTGDDTLVVY